MTSSIKLYAARCSRTLLKHLRKPRVSLMLILLFGALLRLYRLPTSYYYAGDSGLFDLAVINWLKLGGPFPLLGPVGSTGDLHFGPLYYYLTAPGMWLLNWHPLGAVAAVFALNLGAGALGYLLLRRHASHTAGLLFAGIYMASSFSISLSRGSWNPNPLAFFTVLALFGLAEFVKTKRIWTLGLVGFAIGCGLQLHYVVLAEIPIVLASIWVLSRRSLTNWRVWAALAVGFILPLIPFLLGQVLSGGADLAALWNNLTGPHVQKDVGLVDNIKRLFLPFDLYFTPWSKSALIRALLLLLWASIICVVTWAAYVRRSKPKESAIYTIALIFFVLSFLATALQKLDLYPHYYYFYDILVPIMISLVIGLFLKKDNSRKVRNRAAIALYAMLLVWSMVGLPKIYRTDRPVAVERAAGIIASDFIASDQGGSGNKNPANIQVISPATTAGGFEYRTFLERAGISTQSGLNTKEPSYIIIESADKNSVPLNPSWFTGKFVPKQIGVVKAEGVIDLETIGHIKIYRVVKK